MMTRDHITELRNIAKTPAPASWISGVELERPIIGELMRAGLLRWDGGAGYDDDGQPEIQRIPAHRITPAGEAVLLAYELGRAEQ